MANVTPNDPNVDAPAIVPTLTEEDAEEEVEDPEEDPEEDPKEDPKEDPEEEPEDDDDDMEMDDEAEVIDPYMDDGSNNPPPLNYENEETPPTSPVIPDADCQPIPPIASDGLERLGKMEKFMSERIDTEGRIKKKFKEQDHHFLGLGCDNIEMDRTVRKVMSDFSGLKKLVKDLSDRFDEYERSKVFYAKRVLEEELVKERNGKEFYQEFGEYMCQMLQNRQKSEGSFPLPLGSQVREPSVEPFARPVPAPYPDDPYSIGTYDDEADSSSSRPKRARITENAEEALMACVLYEFLLWGNCNMKLKNRMNEMGSDEVLFTSEAWKRNFDINELIYTKLCHEFYATFEFDEDVADDELMTKKAIKFRLCGKAYAMSIQDFSKRLDEEKGVGTQRESLICCGQFVTRIMKRLGILSDKNYIPWSSRLLRYAKSRPNRKLIHNSILNGPYVRKMIPEPGDANRDTNITKTSYLQTDDELSDKELKQIEADDQ
nr:hypothetical protein [Tanacetum cinerariifolium]